MVARTVAGLGPAGEAVVKGILPRYTLLAALSLLAAPLWGVLGVQATVPELLPVRFYQRVLSPLDGRDCPSYPTCTRYAEQAVESHGLLVGSWLALDRLIHEGGDLEHPILVRIGGEVRSFDPLARNDHWLEEIRHETIANP